MSRYTGRVTGHYIELHLSADPAFTAKRWGQRVIGYGGAWSHVRGDQSKRFVKLPFTNPAIKLAEELLAAFPRRSPVSVLRGRDATTVIFRAVETSVYYIEKPSGLRKALRQFCRDNGKAKREALGKRRAHHKELDERREASERSKDAFALERIKSLDRYRVLASVFSQAELATIEDALAQTGCLRPTLVGDVKTARTALIGAAVAKLKGEKTDA